VPALKRSLARVLLVLLILVSANALWSLHIAAWNPSMRTPVVGYDAAQYALAARELAEHGRLATTYALPIELAKHAAPPWALAVLQPGLVIVEAAIFKATPYVLRIPGAPPLLLKDPRHRELLVLVLPYISFLAIAGFIGLATMHLILRRRPGSSILLTSLAGAAVSLAFALDPEAQHFAAGGFTELPFTLGLVSAAAALALGLAPRVPLLFGLLLGVTGLFRGNILWIAPWFIAGTAIVAPNGRRVRAIVLTLVGVVLPLAPWWIYKWRAFGSPAWDLSMLSLWDGVGGRSWFTLNHLPTMPALPSGLAAIGPIAAKILGNLPRVLLALFTGPRALWVGGLIVWLFARRPRDGAWAAALAILGAMASNLLVASATIPWMRYLFPTRILVEAAGMLAVWDLVAHWGPPAGSRSIVRIVRVGVAAVALAWGVLQTGRGLDEAATSSAQRGTPSSETVEAIVDLMDAEVPPNEPVMSNLGPILAWRARRPVVHLALTPDDVDACRRRLAFSQVILVFRDAERAWRGWDEVLAHPDVAPSRPEWNVRSVRQFTSPDGFSVVWLSLGPPSPGLARAGARPSGWHDEVVGRGLFPGQDVRILGRQLAKAFDEHRHALTRL
jgi:hypothetical protein